MSISYSVDLKAPGRPYPHYWEFCVGSCHAATILREGVREHIRRAHRECGFRYLRFHGLFDDDMSVYFVPMFGEPVISFYNIDCIFDFLLDTGMKPFIELGFMPTALASGDYTLFHYKANATMPKDDAEWQRLIRLFAEHLSMLTGDLLRAFQFAANQNTGHRKAAEQLANPVSAKGVWRRCYFYHVIFLLSAK